jgi:hypothetical protein
MSNLITVVEKHFDNILVTDSDNELKCPNRSSWIKIGTLITEDDLAQLELIVNTKGFIRGNIGDRGKWMRQEEVIKILQENPKWLRITKFQKRFGL